eukprot:COSAG05_NODE_939_length_6517_cov_2.480524_5_plen_601_part_00
MLRIGRPGWRAAVKMGLLALVAVPPLAWQREMAAVSPQDAVRPAGEAGWLPRREVMVRPVFAPQKIPRVLHQVWKTHEVPKELQGYVNSWRTHNPDWEYRLWNDTESMALIKEHYPWFHKHIHHFKSGVEKADIFRYFILYHHGGVYMDLDMECIRPWEPLLARHDESFQCVLGAEPHAHAQKQQMRNILVCNAAMFSAPRHPFWEEVFNALLDKVAEIAADGGWLSPVDTTGPGMLSLLYDMKPQAFAGVMVYPSPAFYPLRDSHDKDKAVTDPRASKWRNSWAVHRWIHLWLHKKKGPKDEHEHHHHHNHDEQNAGLMQGDPWGARDREGGVAATFLGDINGGGGYQTSILQLREAVPEPAIKDSRSPLLFATVRHPLPPHSTPSSSGGGGGGGGGGRKAGGNSTGDGGGGGAAAAEAAAALSCTVVTRTEDGDSLLNIARVATHSSLPGNLHKPAEGGDDGHREMETACRQADSASWCASITLDTAAVSRHHGALVPELGGLSILKRGRVELGQSTAGAHQFQIDFKHDIPLHYPGEGLGNVSVIVPATAARSPPPPHPPLQSASACTTHTRAEYGRNVLEFTYVSAVRVSACMMDG